jgi:hypothetical protein
MLNTHPKENKDINETKVTKEIAEEKVHLVSDQGKYPNEIPQIDPKVMIPKIVTGETTILEQMIPIMTFPDKSLHVTLTANKTFSFYDIENHLLGTFTIHDLIKYISQFVDHENKFMSTTDIKDHRSLIETHIGVITSLPTYGMIEIHIQDPIKSPFVGDINVLITLYKMLKNYETSELETALSFIEDKTTKEMIYRSVKLFIYTFVEHILRVIAHISLQIKDDPEKMQLKEKLMQYNMSLVYAMSQYMMSELAYQKIKYTALNSGIEEIKSVELVLKQNLESLTTKTSH